MQTRQEVIAALAAGKINEDQALKCLAALDREASQRALTLKVSEKGAISVYGLGRWPLTLYVEQFIRLLDHGTVIRQFAKDNNSLLSRKGDGESKVVAKVEAAVAQTTPQAEPKAKAKTNGKAAAAAAVAG